MSKSYESLVYGEKRALQAWKSAVTPLLRRVDPPVEDLVWELLVLFGDNLTSPSADIDEDITRTAYELGQIELETKDLKSVNQIFRDSLVRAIIEQIECGDEIMQGVVHFTTLISDAFSQCYVDRLRKMIRHQRAEGVSNELRMAKHIQQHLLPRQIPKIPGFQFAGRLIPAAEIGGDYWSIKHYPEDGIVTMKLADITGHGVAAATLVAAVKFISGGYYKASSGAADVMERTNHVLVKETPTEILVSMVYAWLYPETSQITIVNAGHEPVFICKRDACTNISPTGPVMGVSDVTYGEVHMSLETGDIICFASDGITEAGAPDVFGMDRLKAAVSALKDGTADEIADGVLNAVGQRSGRSRDDLSILVIKVVGS